MTEQNETTPIADNNSVTNDSTKADTNDQQGIPPARVAEITAQKHKAVERGDSYKAKYEQEIALKESARKKDLEKQGEYKTLLDEQAKELDKYKADSTAWNDYKTNKRESIMETITNDEDKKIAEKLPISELEMFANRVTQTNTLGTPNQRPANSTKGTGEFGGYSSYAEWATKDPKGYEIANGTVGLNNVGGEAIG
jgi:hypothetical protein